MDKQQLDALDALHHDAREAYPPQLLVFGREALAALPALLAIAREHEQTQRDLAAAREELASAHALIDAHQRSLVPLYTSGYMRGHHDTVEGGFVVVHQSDESTYFSLDVDEWLRERAALSPTPGAQR